jgi:hypothetical protein
MLVFSRIEAEFDDMLAGPIAPSNPFGGVPEFPSKAVINAGEEGALVVLTFTPAANNPDSLVSNELLSLLTSCK